MIRLFNPDKDLAVLRELIYSEKVQANMDEVKDISDDELIEWMQEDGQYDSLLYAICDGKGEVRGFVYFYPYKLGGLEISYAKTAGTLRQLILDSIKESMLQAKHILGNGNKVRITADIEEQNVPSVKLAKDLGFNNVSKGQYVMEI